MIDLDLLQDYLNGLGLSMEFYQYLFPDEAQYAEGEADITDSIAFSLKSNNSNPVVSNSNLRCLIRSDHPQKCKEVGADIIRKLNMVTDVVLGNTQIVLFKPFSLNPEAIGLDANGNHIFQVDITVVASPLN